MSVFQVHDDCYIVFDCVIWPRQFKHCSEMWSGRLALEKGAWGPRLDWKERPSQIYTHTQRKCAILHTHLWVSGFLSFRFNAYECHWCATCSELDQAFSQISFRYCTFKTSVCKWPICYDCLTSVCLTLSFFRVG